MYCRCITIVTKLWYMLYTIIHKETIFTCTKGWSVSSNGKKNWAKKKTCFQPKSRKSKRTDGTKKPKATRRFKANDIKNYTKSKHLKHSIYKGDYKIRCKIQLHTAYKKFLVAEVSQQGKCLLRIHEYLSLNPSTHIKVVCSHKHLNCSALVRRQAEPQGSLVRQSNRNINLQVQ